ncbi:hypothetical protein N0B21_20845 [Bacillus velezensis]|uniref:hypothetical protein n=1 Tax=Bacillus velezensis TaxID=492670 RepID=UPI0021B12E89|nr:hypothetical protein [Bacillus velezensis]MCT6684633.1 hypothetical protein [Bacillus velezensis]
MTGVYLVNRPHLELEFNRNGIRSTVENFIENMKEQVRDFVLNAGEEFAVESNVSVNNVAYKVLAKFNVLKNKDNIEDGEIPKMKLIEFTSIDLIQDCI